MQQLSLACADKTQWQVLLSALDDAVTYLGLKEVVFKLNVAKSTLCDAMHDRNDRRWAQEWTLEVLEMLRDRYSATGNQLANAILDAQAVVTRRFKVVSIDHGMTDEERAVMDRAAEIARKHSRSL